jgi:hypothetical protein
MKAFKNVDVKGLQHGVSIYVNIFELSKKTLQPLHLY